MTGIVYLMYHELRRDGRALCQSSPGYVRYAVDEKRFREQLSLLQTLGYRGLNVSQALGPEVPEPAVAITFDDGCETDFLAAVPLLNQFGFNATFYAVSGWIGRAGFLSIAQLREISESGCEVGCHSRTHPNLWYLDAAGLHEEIAVAKAEIEQMIGRPVKHFSCPGGFCSHAAARTAAKAGFETIATSRIGTNFSRSKPFRLARVAMYHDLSLSQFERTCRGKGLFIRRSEQLFRDGAKKLLGESSYRLLRESLLRIKTH